jgi:ribonucleotide reductase alpha subunit
MEQEMQVTKRDGSLQEVSFDKILQRVKKIGNEVTPPLVINYSQLIMKVIDQLYDKIPTYVIDELTAEQCAALTTKHLDYATLANRIVVSNNHKITTNSFYTAMETLYMHQDVHGVQTPLISPAMWTTIQQNQTALDRLIDYERDYLFDYFGFKTLERSYLLRVKGVLVERPQHMWLRVALGIHSADLLAVKETYDLLSQKYFTHATPTLYNAGTPHPQLSSCYLLSLEADSIDGIYNTLKECAQISKWAGGIGLHIHNIRATGTAIVGTNGQSNGIVPMLQVFNATARYVDQGGGKRNGSFAIYLEPWHADVEMFLDLKKNHGDEELRARDLFYALWIPDLFMEKVKQDADWALFCPHKCPGLADCYGEAFTQLYNQYVAAGKANKVIKARALWFKILDSQMETGTPYLLYKDAANQKSNQQNLGVIKSSNLCVAPETLILTDKGYIAIKTLEGKRVNVWNGEEFSATTVHKTGVNQEVLTVETSDGCILECTPYHKFYIQRNDDTNNDTNVVKQIEAAKLEVCDTLIQCDYPLIDGVTEYVFSIDTVPINASLAVKMNWLSHYCASELYNSNIVDDVLYISKSASNSSTQFLVDIKLMLQTCGRHTHIAYHTVKPTLIVYSDQLYQLIFAGFEPPKNTVRFNNQYKPTQSSVCIKNITKTGRITDTYCFNEPKKHAGIFNGIITSQCTEILEYSDAEETAVCNLASIGLSKFITTEKTFDYAMLHQVTKVVTTNLNKIIDVNFYPTEKTRISNLLHRPIGIGVQGLADAFALMDIAYHSDEALHVNKLIFETIYHAALECSNELAKARQPDMQLIEEERAADYAQGYENIFAMSMCDTTSKQYLSSREYVRTTDYALHNFLNRVKPIPHELDNLSKEHLGAYSTFTGSPAAKGQLQFDLWGVTPPSDRYDWHKLKTAITTHGLRNSLLVAPMPTASTSQILGNNECFEPFTSNIYSRRTNAGEFVLVNKYLMSELQKLGLWNDELKNNIIANKGSIQQIAHLPAHLKQKYKIVWEIPMKHLIDMAADRGAFICQSQSLNLWLEDPDYKTLTSMHFYGWEKGLKTGIYYLRRKAKHQAQQFTIVPKEENIQKETSNECEMCSS